MNLKDRCNVDTCKSKSDLMSTISIEVPSFTTRQFTVLTKSFTVFCHVTCLSSRELERNDSFMAQI